MPIGLLLLTITLTLNSCKSPKDSEEITNQAEIETTEAPGQDSTTSEAISFGIGNSLGTSNDGYTACIRAGNTPYKCSSNPDRGTPGNNGYATCINRGNDPYTCSSNPDRGPSVKDYPGYSSSNYSSGYNACINAGNTPYQCSSNPDRGSAGSSGYAACIQAGNSPSQCSSNPDKGPSVSQRYNSCVRNGQSDSYCSQAPQSWYQNNTTNNQTIVNTNNGYVACVAAGNTPSVCSQNPDRSAAYGPGGYTRCIMRGNTPAECSRNPDRGWSSALYNQLLDKGVPLATAYLESIGIPASDYLEPFELLNLRVSGTTTTSASFSWFSGGGKTVSFAVAKSIGKIPPANCTEGIDVTPVKAPSGIGLFQQVTFTAPNLTPATTYSFRFCPQNGAGIVSKGIPLTVTTAGSVHSIDAGGKANGTFTDDGKFSGGKTFATKAAVNRDLLTNPAPMAVYQTVRYGNMNYTLDGLQAGRNYKVRLHFAEINFDAANKRKFNVTINSVTVLKNFDVLKSAGGKNIGLIREFTFPANAAGQILVNFADVLSSSIISGIEVSATLPIDVGTPSFPATSNSSSQFKGTGQDPVFVVGLNSTSALRPWIGKDDRVTTQSFQFNRLTVGRTYAMRVFPANVTSIDSWWQTDVTSGSATVIDGYSWSPVSEGYYSKATPWIIKFIANTPSITIRLSSGDTENGGQMYFGYVDTIGVENLPMQPFYQVGFPSVPKSEASFAEFTSSNDNDTFPMTNGLLSNVRQWVGYKARNFTQSFTFDRLNPGQTYAFRVLPAIASTRRATWVVSTPANIGEIISGEKWASTSDGYLPETESLWTISFVPTGNNLTLTLAADPAIKPWYSINAGGPGIQSYTSDTSFAGGKTSSTRSAIRISNLKNPAPMSVYQTLRFGNSTYTLGGLTKGDSYLVRLHFAETVFRGKNQRLFNVAINENQVLTDFDIFTSAGGANIGLIREFTAAADAEGKLVVKFMDKKSNAAISAIEVYDVNRPASFLYFDYFDSFAR
jgi:hypothetical protein